VSFQLRVSALSTDVIASGLLLKTPCAADAYTEGLSKKEQRFGNSGTLAQEVQSGFIYQRGLLQTPTTTERAEPPQKMRARAERNGYKNGTQFNGLASQVVYGMLGTPTTRPRPRSERFAEGRTMNPQEFANAMLPTPTATSDPKGGCTRHDPTLGKTSQLNPRFVAEMMGFPVNWTELPFQSGEPKASKPTETP
jgi:hypothetical protein